MDSDIWLPLATLVLGWAGAQVTEMRRDRRTTTRERLARRAELQRTTLLELQDALLDLMRGAAGTEYSMLTDLEDEEQRKQIVQANLQVAVARGRVELLISRVDDERVRELATASANASLRVGEEDPDLERPFSVAVARIGELLRERYQQKAPGTLQGPSRDCGGYSSQPAPGSNSSRSSIASVSWSMTVAQ
jgi:hypothetical protein